MRFTRYDFPLAVTAAIANLNICLVFITNSWLAVFWSVLIAVVLVWLAREDPVEKTPVATPIRDQEALGLEVES